MSILKQLLQIPPVIRTAMAKNFGMLCGGISYMVDVHTTVTYPIIFNLPQIIKQLCISVPAWRKQHKMRIDPLFITKFLSFAVFYLFWTRKQKWLSPTCPAGSSQSWRGLVSVALSNENGIGFILPGRCPSDVKRFHLNFTFNLWLFSLFFSFCKCLLGFLCRLFNAICSSAIRGGTNVVL